MQTIRRRISRILLIATLLSLLPQASVSATPRPGAPAAPSSPQAAPLPLPADLSALDAPAAAPSAAPALNPDWDLEHFPMFNPVLAKPFAIATTGNMHTKAHTVRGPNNTLHAVFYRYAATGVTGGWYYATTSAIESGLPTPTSSSPAVLVVAAEEPSKVGIYARIAVDDAGGVHIIWLDNLDYDVLNYKACASQCTLASTWAAAATVPVLDTRPERCRMAHPSIVAWGSGANLRVVVAAQYLG
ncbi:MAG TPA: hypothetical protein VD886_15710, partial [Herpetosiphonaceae bacterium]|nr:hypothetical protein [Herpetosiphonaceae bacterium]